MRNLLSNSLLLVLSAIGPVALAHPADSEAAGQPGVATKHNNVRVPDKLVAPKPSPIARPASGPLAFIENQGQFAPDVKFQVRRGGKILWFTNSSIVFDAERPVAKSITEPDDARASHARPKPLGQSAIPNGRFERLVFSEEFTGGQKSPKIDASQQVLPGIYNFFIGNDPKKWRTGVRSYAELVYQDVWPGIDVRFIAKAADIEQEFVVHPGVDASLIRVGYHGVDGVDLTKDGSLVVRTSFGPFNESAPRIYEEVGLRRAAVRGRYRISGELAYTFQVGPYSTAHTLVIDPTLLFSTYIGGTGSDVGTAIAVDPAGNSYIAGYTILGSGYPISTGVVQSNCPRSSGCRSGVVTALDALGRLRYSTYLGSSFGGDQARGIAVSANGEAYVAGLAQSSDFPTTASAFQSSCSGSTFVAKLNSTGSGLLYSTCLGADDLEATTYYGIGGAAGIAIDTSGRAYVTGNTSYNAYPTTSGAFQPTLAGSTSAFVAVIDPSLSGTASLVYCSYLGGEVQDYGRAIAVDAYGSAYIQTRINKGT